MIGLESLAQTDSTASKLKFGGDFRFRIEHDWNSQNSSGVARDDRSRLRYRFRYGIHYSLDKNSSFGARLRTGNTNDQQGPHITIGGNEGEFGLVKIGFEKLFYEYQSKNFTGWVGKNTIPIKKINELFWNDNVFPEGIALKYWLHLGENSAIPSVGINAGHFIIRSSNKTFDKDSYLQVLQFESSIWDRITVFPAFYYFNQVGNFPDGQETFHIDYSIFHLGSLFKITKNLNFGAELYANLEDYSKNDSIPSNLQDQKQGIVLSAKYGKVKKKGDWLFHLYYAHLEKFAVVDYFAQNDWARWDYSSIDAAGSRITNFQGVEARIGYAIKENFNLILRTYFVEELKKVGIFKENGSRIRLDLNIGF